MNNNTYITEMKKITLFFVASISLFCLSSCIEKEHRNQEYAEETYVKIYKPQSVEAWGMGAAGGTIKIVPAEYDKSFERESRSFYTSLDTSLVFKGWRYKITNGNRQLQEWCAIDFRITKIDVVTLEDYDASHPAGSSLNDLMRVSYEYMHEIVSKKLNDISYGNLMLIDYFPYSDAFNCIEISSDVAPDEVPLQFKSYEVTIETAYGDQYKLKYPKE